MHALNKKYIGEGCQGRVKHSGSGLKKCYKKEGGFLTTPTQTLNALINHYVLLYNYT